MAGREPSTASPEQEDSIAAELGPRKPSGVAWLARCLFPTVRRKEEDSSCSSSSAVPAEPLRQVAAGEIHSSFGVQEKQEEPPKVAAEALHWASPTVADVNQASHEQLEALPSSTALPRELLDTEDVDVEALSGDAALLPPLPTMVPGKSLDPPVRSEMDLPGKPSLDLWDALVEEAAQPRLRPTTFRRGRPSAAAALRMLGESSLSRPTTAGEESAGSRQSMGSSLPSWREEWTPGSQLEANAPRLRGSGSACGSKSSLPEGRPPKPPPMAGATAAEDPGFTLALKRASQSVNLRSATPPVDRHRRRWSRDNNDRYEDSSAADRPESADGVGNMTPERVDGAQTQAYEPGRFSDLAMSFASLDESM